MHDDDEFPLHTHEEMQLAAQSMGDRLELTTVGIDVGSSTSHLMFSRLCLERMGQFLSSRYVVVERSVLHRSPILLTPYRADYTIDDHALSHFVQDAYQEAGLHQDDVDSGAIILTGEAVKRTNARAIAELFAHEAGKFVCATAGPNLEAVMAAHGSGAIAVSGENGQAVLNVDIGGGTTKLALIQHGAVVDTCAINVGGRLIAMDAEGRIVRIEPAARDVAETLGIELQLGRTLAPADAEAIATSLAGCLLQLIRGEALSPLAKQLLVTPALSGHGAVDGIVFSGGVSEYLYGREQRDFGDLAQRMAAAVRAGIDRGGLKAPIMSGAEGIRATVMGASQFTVQVSGNTIAISRSELLPLRNLQVVYPRIPQDGDLRAELLSEAIRKGFQRLDLVEGEQAVALALDWNGTPHYPALRSLAKGVVEAIPNTLSSQLPVVLVFNNDFGKLVGNLIREEFHPDGDIISIDGIDLKEFDYIDVGQMLLPARVVPVVVKSLVFPTVDGVRGEVLDR